MPKPASDKCRSRRFYGRYYLAVRFFLRKTLRPPEVAGRENIRPGGAIYVARHYALQGPIRIALWAGIPKLRVWVLHVFCTRRGAYAQYRRHTAPHTLGLGPWRAWLMAALCAAPASRLMASGRAIPVYRGERDIMKTVRASVEALKQGQNLLIMPEVDYTGRQSEVYQLYNGFLHVAQIYGASSGRDVPIIPIRVAADGRNIRVEKPIEYNHALPFRRERERIVRELREALGSRD